MSIFQNRLRLKMKEERRLSVVVLVSGSGRCGYILDTRYKCFVFRGILISSNFQFTGNLAGNITVKIECAVLSLLLLCFIDHSSSSYPTVVARVVSSIFHLPSSILHPPSSILHPSLHPPHNIHKIFST